MITTVKERPILFSGPMVQAIRAGTKTQTRRIIKQQPTKPLSGYVIYSTEPNCSERFHFSNGDDDAAGEYRKCPYGHPGDRLWVRESLHNENGLAVYNADGEIVEYTQGTYGRWQWTRDSLPSIHMPRKASRLTLEITGVRAERLHQISEADALAEGCDGKCPVGNIQAWRDGPHVYHFAQLWEQINGTESWDSNPWVWVINFKRTA